MYQYLVTITNLKNSLFLFIWKRLLSICIDHSLSCCGPSKNMPPTFPVVSYGIADPHPRTVPEACAKSDSRVACSHSTVTFSSYLSWFLRFSSRIEYKVVLGSLRYSNTTVGLSEYQILIHVDELVEDSSARFHSGCKYFSFYVLNPDVTEGTSAIKVSKLEYAHPPLSSKMDCGDGSLQYNSAVYAGKAWAITGVSVDRSFGLYLCVIILDFFKYMFTCWLLRNRCVLVIPTHCDFFVILRHNVAQISALGHMNNYRRMLPKSAFDLFMCVNIPYPNIIVHRSRNNTRRR